MNVVKTSIREYLAEHGTMTYRISGGSMKPMLRQERDLVILRRYDGEGLQKYDVAMYDRGGFRRYVLHRVVSVSCGEDGERYYTFLGDNCAEPERGIPEEAVVGVLEAFDRKGRTVSVTDRGYRIYSRVWYAMYPLRRVWLRVRHAAAKVPGVRKIYHILRGR